MRLLLLGATGLVGSSTLKLALANPGISEVVAITRRPLPPQNKLLNPVCERIEELAQSARTWVVDAVVCALGTTKAKAGTREALRHVDYDLPQCSRRSATQRAQKHALSYLLSGRPPPRCSSMPGRKGS
jgi:uncharacterized protein YbjT (DUF2867 family)